MIENEERLAGAVRAALVEAGYPARDVTFRRIPFSGAWGVATSVAKVLAGEVGASKVSAATAGLDKKEAKRRATELLNAAASEIAEQVAACLRRAGVADRVESPNGYINIFFDTASVAGDVVTRANVPDGSFGRGPRRGERVMVEFSQPNTHKAFHIGHLRNVALGNALSNILEWAGYDVIRANYIGDMGLHVIKCLWCYERFHRDEEPAANRGTWLGAIYAESDARLRFRQDVVKFLTGVVNEDETFRLAADRMLKALWRSKRATGEDIAYLLGQLTQRKSELDLTKLRDANVIVDLWPIIGEQLREEATPTDELAPIVDAGVARQRLAEYERLDSTFDWWLPAPRWEAEVREMFQRWERKEPDFVALWTRTKAWSMEEFREIYDQLGVRFDVWFFESEVEERGRAIVDELLQKGIAQMSDGLPVVKIDELLGLTKERYRVLPILRSDGTTLYSTKDLALTRDKFEQYGIDRSIWVIDVRQSLYMRQIFKILELWGFEQATRSHHLAYEMVALPDGVISSRRGNAPEYQEIAAEVLRRAREVVDAKNPELAPEQRALAARQVGVGALIYGMLDRDNNKLLVFDIEQALSLQGQSAPYIQYAHARACRILERAGEVSSNPPDFSQLTSSEINLIERIAEYPAEVERAAREYKPLIIATYVYELAALVNEFYEQCRVLDAPEPLRGARLHLLAAARRTLASGLALLGIAAPEAM